MAGLYIKWPPRGSGGSGGGSSGSQTGVAYVVGPLDTAPANPNGGAIGSFSFYQQSAGAVFPGLVSSADQTFSGVKTFNSAPTFASLGSAPLRVSSGAVITGSVSLTSEVSGSLSLSRLSAAVAADSIDNTTFSQAWNWDSLSSQSAMRFASSSITSGTILGVQSTFDSSSATGKAIGVVVSGTNNITAGIDIQHAGTSGSARGINVNMIGASSATGVSVSNGTTGAGKCFLATLSNTSNTGPAIVVTSASDSDGKGMTISMTGSSGNQDGLAITMAANGGSTTAGVRSTLSGGSAGGACFVGFVNAQNAYVLDAEVAALGGVQDIIRLKNTNTAGVGNGSQIIWSANVTGNSLVPTAAIGSTITNIVSRSQTGSLIFYTCDRSNPVARMTLDHVGKLSSTGSGSFVASVMTMGSVSMTSSAEGQTYTLRFPGTPGSAGQLLSTDGNGNLSWVDPII